MPPDSRAERQALLRESLARERLDGMLVQHLANIRYLTGFTGSAALLLLRTGAETVLITDFRYASQAPAEAGNAAEVLIEQVNLWRRLASHLADRPVERLGYESHVATGRDLARLEHVPVGLTPTADVVERLRAVKEPAEVASIRAAASLASDALDEAIAGVRAGQTEFEVAAALEHALRRRGSEWHPFPTIVASGPRSALPHARTSHRVLEPGDLLLLDFGAQVDGYCADLTRMFVIGRNPDDRQAAVHEIVREAQCRAIAGMKAGMPCRAADALARDHIAGHGFGEAFGHSLGHGLGLEVHEAPRLSPATDDPLPAHAVVTVEPGIYFPGWGGIRLEDDIHLGPGGAELLSDGRTELHVIG